MLNFSAVNVNAWVGLYMLLTYNIKLYKHSYNLNDWSLNNIIKYIFMYKYTCVIIEK